MNSNNGRCWFLLGALAFAPCCAAADAAGARIHALKVTVLSTMLADRSELGEWGFSALVEADGHRMLFDTGAHADLVLTNVRSMGIDLATVPEVILSHNHSDHVGGFLTLRRSVLARAPGALSRTHVGEGIFYPRTSGIPGVEANPMVLIKPEYEATGGVFISHDKPEQIYPGVWLTGPVPRKYPERNWSETGKVKTPAGWVEDNLPEDMSLVFDTDAGLVILTGCGSPAAGMRGSPTSSIIRGRSSGPRGSTRSSAASTCSTPRTKPWLGRLQNSGNPGVDSFLGAHCTGVETVFRFRALLGLDRAHAVVAAVGSSYDPGERHRRGLHRPLGEFRQGTETRKRKDGHALIHQEKARGCVEGEKVHSDLRAAPTPRTPPEAPIARDSTTAPPAAASTRSATAPSSDSGESRPARAPQPSGTAPDGRWFP